MTMARRYSPADGPITRTGCRAFIHRFLYRPTTLSTSLQHGPKTTEARYAPRSQMMDTPRSSVVDDPASRSRQLTSSSLSILFSFSFSRPANSIYIDQPAGRPLAILPTTHANHAFFIFFISF